MRAVGFHGEINEGLHRDFGFREIRGKRRVLGERPRRAFEARRIDAGNGQRPGKPGRLGKFERTRCRELAAQQHRIEALQIHRGRTRPSRSRGDLQWPERGGARLDLRVQ